MTGKPPDKRMEPARSGQAAWRPPRLGLRRVPFDWC